MVASPESLGQILLRDASLVWAWPSQGFRPPKWGPHELTLCPAWVLRSKFDPLPPLSEEHKDGNELYFIEVGCGTWANNGSTLGAS